MEEILASNPEILKELKTDLVHLLDRRLQDLGIDPEWSGVPSKTYKTKMAVLKHHQKITAKRHTSYFTIRDHLLQNLEDRYMSKPNEIKPTTPRQNIMTKLRKRASQVLSMARPNFGLTKKGEKALTVFVEVKDSKPTDRDTTQELNARTVVKPTGSEVLDRLKDVSNNVLKPKEDFHTAPTPLNRGLLNKPKDVFFSYKETVESEDLSDPLQEIMGRSSSKSAMDPSLTRTRSEFVLSSSSENDGAKSPLDLNQPVRIYKSAMRNAASTGNLAKKKVVFLDELFSGNKKSFSDDMMNITPPEACVTPRNSATSIDSRQQSVEEIHDQSNQRLNSSNLDSTTVVHSTPQSHVLQLPKPPSPASSLTSIGSSLLDISPTDDPKSKTSEIKGDKYNLEWSVEDIEENLKSD